MSDRNRDHLSPAMKPKCLAWEQEMKAAGINYLITCTLRTMEEQKALFAQGRTVPGHIVTWTLHSKHLTGDAFDFVIMFNGKPDWMVAHRDLWDKAAEIGRSLDLSQVLGKDGHVLELAHLQV